MEDCIFCRIVRGEVPAEKLFEDDELIAFRDNQPAAPLHVLVVPKEHVATVNDLTEEQLPLVGRMFAVAREIAREGGVAEEGYRLVMNVNRGGGQMVFHIHLHVLGGRRMTVLG